MADRIVGSLSNFIFHLSFSLFVLLEKAINRPNIF